MKKSPVIFFLLVILVLLQMPSALYAADGQKQTIRFAFTYQPEVALVHVAMTKGYFDEEGLDIQPVMRMFGKPSLQAVLDDKADFATVAETPVMFSILNGEKIFVIAEIASSVKNTAVVTRKDLGIADPSMLKGKTIGVSYGTTGDFFLDSLLTANGLTRASVKTVNLKPDQMLEALVSGRIDAACTWNYPLTLIQQELGDNALVFFDEDIYTETFNIAVKQDFLAKNPEAAKKLLRALVKAEKFARQNPAEAKAIFSNFANVDPALVNLVWDSLSYQITLDASLLIMLEDEARELLSNLVFGHFHQAAT
jgi:ABC-type nitrate/sulfonate/bicarbonate transport system substrate-binding protein